MSRYKAKTCILHHKCGVYVCLECPLKTCVLFKPGKISKSEALLLEMALNEKEILYKISNQQKLEEMNGKEVI